VLAEATQTAQFVEQFWTATASRPGLEEVKAFMPHSVAADICSLADASQMAGARAVFTGRTDEPSRIVTRGWGGAVVAEREQETLKKLGRFDVALIDEARKLAHDLLAMPANMGRRASDDIRLRDRLLTLLGRRIAKVRDAAKLVFRSHPPKHVPGTSACTSASGQRS
jgi:hypothetical protein